MKIFLLLLILSFNICADAEFTSYRPWEEILFVSQTQEIVLNDAFNSSCRYRIIKRDLISNYARVTNLVFQTHQGFGVSRSEGFVRAGNNERGTLLKRFYSPGIGAEYVYPNAVIWRDVASVQLEVKNSLLQFPIKIYGPTSVIVVSPDVSVMGPLFIKPLTSTGLYGVSFSLEKSCPFIKSNSQRQSKVRL